MNFLSQEILFISQEKILLWHILLLSQEVYFLSQEVFLWHGFISSCGRKCSSYFKEYSLGRLIRVFHFRDKCVGFTITISCETLGYPGNLVPWFPGIIPPWLGCLLNCSYWEGQLGFLLQLNGNRTQQVIQASIASFL